MIDVSVEGSRVVFLVEGWDKMWALKSRLEIPVEHIKAVRVDQDAAKGWWHGLRLGGSDLPGVITAGTFYRKGRLVFYDTHKPENTIVVDLDHENYDTLVLQVRDPAAAAKTISAAIASK